MTIGVESATLAAGLLLAVDLVTSITGVFCPLPEDIANGGVGWAAT